VEGIRWGKGGGCGAVERPRDCATSVPFWHTTPTPIPVSRSNHYPKTPSPADCFIANGVNLLVRSPAHPPIYSSCGSFNGATLN